MPTKLYMGTTKIAAENTAMEIQMVLVRSGARQIASDYDAQGKIRGLRFCIPVNGQDYAFALPVRTESLTKLCRGDRAQAERVAWRQLLRWTEAQMAMIDVGMVKAGEVYAPYLLRESGVTLWEELVTRQLKSLPAPSGATDAR